VLTALAARFATAYEHPSCSARSRRQIPTEHEQGSYPVARRRAYANAAMRNCVRALADGE
jgi:hypothetical protein